MAALRALRLVLAAGLLVCAACATTGSGYEEEPPLEAVAAAEEAAAPMADEAPGEEEAEAEVEVPLSVAGSEHLQPRAPADDLAEILVRGQVPERFQVISDLVSQAQSLLRDVKLDYVFTGKGKKEVLRGRPVAFALWSEAKKEWTVAHVEIPRPPVKWKPGGKPLAFTVLTPGIQARHVKGTGAERLMFAFSRDGDPLKVYGRKFPVFDNDLLKKKQWRAVAQTAKPIVYLPFTSDTFDPLFVSGGREFLLSTARKALDELRSARVPSAAYAGALIPDVIPVEVLTTLAVIEQTDDADYSTMKADAFNQVLSQYGLKREEAFRYSVSSASALGPMQFTDKRGNGTYSLVARKCRGAGIDPDFERGATNLLNAMKAAACLLDMELGQMRADIQAAYRMDPAVLGIFPVAAYNGGPRNVTKLYNVLKKAGVKLGELGRPGEQPDDKPVKCPCFWKVAQDGTRPVTIPKYNNENRWYVEKYQSILGMFEEPLSAAAAGSGAGPG